MLFDTVQPSHKGQQFVYDRNEKTSHFQEWHQRLVEHSRDSSQAIEFVERLDQVCCPSMHQEGMQLLVESYSVQGRHRRHDQYRQDFRLLHWRVDLQTLLPSQDSI